MTQITQTTILSTFDMVSAAIKANAVLSAKFNDNNILQFEPKHKSNSFYGFPYIWVNIPSSPEEKVVFDNNFTFRDFDVLVVMRVEWEARSKVVEYCNALLDAIGDYESTFEASGYYDTMISLDDVDSNTVIQSKELVEAVFTITWKGHVGR